jgi:hypothetical protein
MSIELISDAWGVLKDHIDIHDRADAADGLVNLLIDNDFGATDIKAAFRGDKDIAMALKFYAEQQDPEDDVDDEDEFEGDE